MQYWNFKHRFIFKKKRKREKNYESFKQFPFSITIETLILFKIFKNEAKQKEFLNIAIKASTVICYRV